MFDFNALAILASVKLPLNRLDSRSGLTLDSKSGSRQYYGATLLCIGERVGILLKGQRLWVDRAVLIDRRIIYNTTSAEGCETLILYDLDRVIGEECREVSLRHRLPRGLCDDWRRRCRLGLLRDAILLCDEAPLGLVLLE